MKLVTNKFKSGGLHEKHVVATWNVGNRLSAFAYRHRETEKPQGNRDARWQMDDRGLHVRHSFPYFVKNAYKWQDKMNSQCARNWVQTAVADAKELPQLLSNATWQQDFASLPG